MRDVVEAQGGMARAARLAGLNRESKSGSEQSFSTTEGWGGLTFPARGDNFGLGFPGSRTGFHSDSFFRRFLALFLRTKPVTGIK